MLNPQKITLATHRLQEEDPWAWWSKHSHDAGQLMAGESPRGGAVLARAYLETLLEEYLLHLALTNRQRRKDIVEAVNRNFDAMARYCDQLTIEKSALAQIKIIRKIGNRFAHDPLLRQPGDDPIVLGEFAKLQLELFQDIPFDPKNANLLLGTSLTFIIGHLSGFNDHT